MPRATALRRRVPVWHAIATANDIAAECATPPADVADAYPAYRARRPRARRCAHQHSRVVALPLSLVVALALRRMSIPYSGDAKMSLFEFRRGMAWTLAEQAEFAALKRHKLGLLLGDGCAMKGANVDQEAARDLQTRLRKALGNLVRRLASVSKEMQTCP